MRRLGSRIRWFKVGAALVLREGPSIVRAIRREGGRVFLDLKLHDVPSVVGRAARAAAEAGAEILTIHASGGAEMVEAARGAIDRVGGPHPCALVAVTILSSLDRRRLAPLGIGDPLDRVVERLARAAVRAGADGVVASGAEAARLRKALGEGPLLVVPGIRPAGAPRGDQVRVLTPAAALASGGDLLVVGRPVLEARDPVGVLGLLEREILRSPPRG